MTRHLLVIGGQRCGTTYLYSMLDSHPDITMTRPARPEPKVFMSEELSARGVEWYRATYFAHATTETVFGEKSTSYLDDSTAAARAAAVLGDADIIVQLRDPVLRAVSNWRFSTAHRLEERPLAQALTENLSGPRAWNADASSVSPFAYLERGRYLDHLQPWFGAFPGRVHVRFLEDVVTGRATAADLYAAVGVDPTFQPPGADRPVNESTGTAPQLSDDLVAALRGYFRESDLGLTERLRRPLPWPVS